MTEPETAYIAGLIDGEGCIGARFNGRYVNANIAVCMTNPVPLRWAAKQTGIGRVYPQNRFIENRRLVWQWIISKPRTAADFLKRLLPYLLVKKGEAMVFIALASIRDCPRIEGRRPLPEAENKAVRLIATLKGNGGVPDMEAYGQALDLCVYIRQKIAERDNPK